MSSHNTVVVNCLDQVWEVTGNHYKEEPASKTSPGQEEDFEVTAFVLLANVEGKEFRVDMTWLWDNDAFDEQFMEDIKDNAIAELPEDIPPEDEDEDEEDDVREGDE